MIELRDKIVVALGGNAISDPAVHGTIEEQFAQTTKTARQLGAAIKQGYQLVITHGNGPQVGNVLRRVEIARTELYPLPLEVCVADTQAGMGYMISQCLGNELAAHGIDRRPTTIVTSVLVDQRDPAFASASKPIGPRLSKAIAEAHAREDNWQIRAEPDGSFRRVVPSPEPQRIMELETIARLVDAGELIISCGGGGIPVLEDEHGNLSGAAAVIDKDLTTAMLANELRVPTMVILTGVENVCLGFGTEQQRALSKLSVADAKRFLAAGEFAVGSMQPKVEAAVRFLDRASCDNPQAIIGHVDRFGEILAGTSGTRITRG